MPERLIATTPRARRTLRAAVLMTVFACGLLLWESVTEKPAPGISADRPRAASREIPGPPRQIARKEAPARAVKPLPEPPPPPPVIVPVDPATLRLSDIVIDPTDPSARFAVIDGVAVRAGERIGGHPVREVLPDRVLIGEESEVLLLPEEEDR